VLKDIGESITKVNAALTKGIKMQKMKLFFKLFPLILLVFLSACTPAYTLKQDEIVVPVVTETLSAVPTPIPQSTQSPVPNPTIIPTKDFQREALINEAIALLDKNTIEACWEVHDQLLKEYAWFNENDEEIQALWNFSWYLASILEGNFSDSFSLNYLGEDISPDYRGVYHEQISNEILKHISMSQWKLNYQNNSNMVATIQAKLKLPLPSIGMTKEEVKNSFWGSPQKINRTTTAYSVSEQWVYGNGRYVYFEDGIVTAIQD